jgi:hypothetical protein
MIVNMPLKKVKNPGLLRRYVAADSALVNNFTISVSGYHNNYNNYHDFDYLLRSEISIDNSIIGSLNIDYFKSADEGTRYYSQYAFAEGYTAEYTYNTGDTTKWAFSIKNGSEVLYKEERLTMTSDTSREHEYILTIGNVTIIRKSDSDGIAVVIDGVLQTGAIVKIIDKDSDVDASVCKNRDIQITIEDGTVIKVSSLISSNIDNMGTLMKSLHQGYFAANVVDWIAYGIYYDWE